MSTIIHSDATVEGRVMSEVEPSSWDQFVDAHPEGRFCQLSGYSAALQRAYGYACRFVQFYVGGQRVGIFPGIVIKRGHGRLISQPYNEYGGPLLQPLLPHHNAEVASELVRIAQTEGCASVEIRGGIGCDVLLSSNLCARWPLHSFAVLELSDKDTLWRKSLTHETRKGIRQSEKAGLYTFIHRGTDAVKDPFYELYLLSMKRLGSPPHPRAFFDALATGLGQRLVAAWVSDGDRVASVLLGAITGRRLQIYIIASAPELWRSRPNDLAHWDLITWAAEKGIQFFDFGSARYPGQIQYKKKWGVTFSEYCYYLLAPAEQVGHLRIESVDSSSRAMTAMATLWRKLVPLRWTPVLGRPIRRFLTK